MGEFLGSGAFGEVWSATSAKTGRKVAIKFYTRRSSADIQMLAREVEKLVVLAADRYVVQLLDVGWDAEPPYYVMDYIEHGSLEDRLNITDPLPTSDAMELFQEIATAMMHLHGKGILHCDLKPGNVLLDQDGNPRIADFGQSRLSSENTAALGTLFYMAPEQADMYAVPDARWDVYGLGALLYSMLTGKPPFYTEELANEIEDTQDISHRLRNYRDALMSAPKPTDHRKVPGVDRAMADVIDRCIAADPKERFQSVQSVLLALRQREVARARQPLVALGLLGPLLLLTVMTLFGWWAFRQAVGDTDHAVTMKSKESNEFAARLAARSASEQIDDHFRAVRQLAQAPEFRKAYKDFIENEELATIRELLSDPNKNDSKRYPELVKVRKEFIANEVRQRLQPFLVERVRNYMRDYPVSASWFVDDREGNQVAAAFKSDERKETVGRNWSYRTYFTGLARDLKTVEDGREVYSVPNEIERRRIIQEEHLSAIFLSKASNSWKIAFSVPIRSDGGDVIGVVASTAEVGDFVDFEPPVDSGAKHYAMLVDNRIGDHQGIILEHPLFDEYLSRREFLPEELNRCLLDVSSIHQESTFFDPIGKTEVPESTEYAQESIASVVPVTMQDYEAVTKTKPGMSLPRLDTGLNVVTVEDYGSIIAPARSLGKQLGRLALLASLFLLVVAIGMWALVGRMLRDSRRKLARSFAPSAESYSLENMETVGAPTDGFQTTDRV